MSQLSSATPRGQRLMTLTCPRARHVPGCLPFLALWACLTWPLAGQAAPANAVRSPDSLALECPVPRYPEVTPEGSRARLRHWAQQALRPWGVSLGWHAEEGRSFADSPHDRARLRRLLDVVVPTLQRLPRSLLPRYRVRRVVLVKDLTVSGQYRLAMPAPERDSVLLADNGTSLCDAGMALRVLHELHHVFEFRDAGAYDRPDTAWRMLHDPVFRYGQGGASAYGGHFVNRGHPSAGFVSAYAQFAQEEDKAETFAWMLTPGYEARVQAWAQEDPQLAAKVSWMNAWLARPPNGRLPRR